MPKRIVLAIDGTWVNSDNGYQPSASGPQSQGTLAVPSNITRLCRALLPRSKASVEQLVYYQGGLGSSGSWYSFIVGGYLGQGIDEAIREAYGFLCNNYEPGDEIFLLGFSRGAFTARSIGGLIGSIGLLTKKGMEAFYPIFMDWENQNQAGYKSGYGCDVWPLEGRPNFESPAYLQGLIKNELTRPNINIKAIGVFDTVGTLGVPDVKPFGFHLYNSNKSEYSFINTQVANNVEYAYQALALDEARDAFVPTVWEYPREGSKHVLKDLRQCWFPGVHTSVGGGFADTSISDITLAWMMTQLSKHLDFDDTYLPRQRVANGKFYTQKQTPAEGVGYAKGLIKKSDTGLLNTILGKQKRTPGEYHLTNPKTGQPLPELLKNTCEFIHPSVRYREMNGGRGLANNADAKLGEGVYETEALKGWEYVPAGTATPGMAIDPKWSKAGKWVKRDTGTYIVEDRIEQGSFESVLTDSWDGVNKFIGL